MGRGRNANSAQQQAGAGQYAHPYGGQVAPPNHLPGGGPGAYRGNAGSQAPYPGDQQPPRTPAPGEPEYFGYNGGSRYPGQSDPYRSDDDNPGHTRAFALGEGPDSGSVHGGYRPGSHGPNAGDGNVSTYRAGQTTGPPAGPRLPWKQLLSGIILHPQRTFWQTRDYQVWVPALSVTFVYGLLAVFGFQDARDDLLEASTSTSVPWVLFSALAVMISTLMLGAVTNALARQLGGDGAWAPTIGLSMLITSMTDAPRLLFALFLPADHGLVQVLGWVTWLLGGVLLTTMVSKSHDLVWPRALGACSIQLIALLVLLKLPTIGT